MAKYTGIKELKFGDNSYEFGYTTPDDLLSVLEQFASVESSPSESEYLVGDYLIYENKFYKVISPIHAGSNLVVNTNIEKTTVANEIRDLIKYRVDINEATNRLALYYMGG